MISDVTTSPKVYVVILNWNGWGDTVECLESVFSNTYSNYHVIVCDNASSDGSMERFREWADMGLGVPENVDSPVRERTFYQVPRPIRWIQYSRERAERGGDCASNEPPLILIQVGANLGFAGGNNVGMRYAMARGGYEFIWLLNNDTVIDPDALREMVLHMEKLPGAGLCGSTVLYYTSPHRIQAVGGGRYHRMLGRGKLIGNGRPQSTQFDYHWVAKRLDYLLGASMLVRKSFIDRVGLMSEDYFLYFEELDWALRSKDIYSQTYAEKSVVYHKAGGSTRQGEALGVKADYYGARNRLVFTRKYYPYLLPLIYAGLMVACINRLRRGQPARALMMLRLIAGDYSTKGPSC